MLCKDIIPSKPQDNSRFGAKYQEEINIFVMILTTKGRYAVMAMLYIAKYGDNRSVKLSEISKLQNISLNYLEQIFAKLRKAGLVVSVRGPGGGYKLAKSAEDTYAYSITKAVEEEIVITKCGNDDKSTCLPKSVKCLAHDLWSKLEVNITEYLENITLAEVIDAKKSGGDKNIYFDHNATTRTHPMVKKAMLEAYNYNLNPSSVHNDGRYANKLLEESREVLAEALGIKLGIDGYEICFTSTGTEANNLILHNFKDKQIAITEAEHPSILQPSSLNPNSKLIPINKNGLIDHHHLELILEDMEPGSLISVLHANNETGVIQGIKDICALAHKYKILVHSDMVQSFGKIDVNIEELGLDFATISSHKIGGPSGAAALIHRTNFQIMPQILGGGQEKNKRAGTQNVPAIIGFAKAAEIAMRKLDSYSKVSEVRDWIEGQILSISKSSIAYGRDSARLPNTLMINMPNVDAQTQLIYFDMNGFSVSTGSACSSGKVKNSHVISAMGYEDDAGAIRISLGPESKIEDAKKFVSLWENLFKKQKAKVA